MLRARGRGILLECTALGLAVVLTAGQATAKKGDKAGETETAGNCLSFPVIWSDGITKPLRGTMLASQLEGTFKCYPDEPFCWYYQQDLNNEWQAESSLPAAITEVSRIDWGDNLEAKAWPINAIIRVETVLYADLGYPMSAFTMKNLEPDVSGIDEKWGTNGVIYDSYAATVYSGCARLTIQRLADSRDDVDESVLVWNAELGQWDGAAAPTTNLAVWEAQDGPGFYSAEINVQGKVIYGYNWRPDKGAAAGVYRITFSLDSLNRPGDPDITLRTGFSPSTVIDVPVEEVEAADESPDTQGGQAYVVHDLNLSYIDVVLLDEKGGKGGGGNGKGRP